MELLEKFKTKIATGINIWTEQHYKANEPIIYVYCERSAYKIFYTKYIEDHLDTSPNLDWKGQIVVNCELTPSKLRAVYHYNTKNNGTAYKQFYFLDSSEQLFTKMPTFTRTNIHYTTPYSVFNHFLNQPVIQWVCQQILKEHFDCNEQEEAEYFGQFWNAYQTFQKDIALPLMRTIIQKYKEEQYYNMSAIQLGAFIQWDDNLTLWYAPNVLKKQLLYTLSDLPPISKEKLQNHLSRQLIVGFFELYFKALAKKSKTALRKPIEDLLCEFIHPTHYFPPSLRLFLNTNFQAS